MKDEYLILEEIRNEEKNIASFKYKNIIDEIYKYVDAVIDTYLSKVNSYYSENELNGKLDYKKLSSLGTIIIPEEITSKIKFINDLTIKVDLATYDYLVPKPYCQNRAYNLEMDANNKFKSETIEVICKHIGSKFFKTTLYNSLFYELNYLHEEYQNIKNKKELMLNEEEILKQNIFEENGVVCLGYKNAIDDIFEYVKKIVEIREEYFKSFMRNYNSSDFQKYTQLTTFTIPNELTKQIDFLKNLNIVIMLQPDVNTPEQYTYGAGKYDVGFDYEGKICQATISITCMYKGNYVYERSFYNNMYHELSHLYQAYKQFDGKELSYTKDKFVGHFDKPKDDKKYFSNFDEYIFSDIESGTTKNEACDFISTCMYRLFNNSEVRSLVSGVYGDLRQYYPDYNNTPDFQETVHKTQAYSLYKQLSDEKEAFLSCITNENFQKVKDALPFFKNEPNANSYRKRLRMFIDDRLDDFLRNIGRAASLYYNEMEDRKNIGLFGAG